MGLTTKEISSSSFNDMISSVDRRSEYVENRAGANVRLNNFLTPYTLDDKSSILNAPCGYSNGVYPSLRPVQTFGPELIDLTQGTAEQPSQWSNITTNSVNFLTGAAGTRYFNINSTQGTLISGKKYSLTLEISNYSGSDTLGLSTQGNVSINARFDTNATHSEVFTSNGQSLRIFGRATNSATITLSVKEVIDADFDFTRGSAATRVTKDGLIKNVQILSDELVQNGDFEQIGSELITNGDFATDLSGWTPTGTNATNTITWEQGGARIISTDANISLSQYNVLTVGKAYKLTCDVNVTTGGIGLDGAILVGGSTVNLVNGFNEIYFVANSTTLKIKRVISVSNCLLDNVSVKEVGQNWDIGSDWQILDGKLKYNSSSSNSSSLQDFNFTSGKKYKIEFEISDFTTDYRFDLYTGFSFIQSAIITSQTSFSYIFEGDGGIYLRFRGLERGTGFSVDNVSVIEITDDTDIPRIDYTDGTGHLLLEPQSTNTATYSNDFTQGDIFNSSGNPGVDAGVLTSQQAISPDGTNNAWLLKDDNSGGNGQPNLRFYNTTVTSNDFNTVSIFAKKALTNDFIVLRSTGFDTSGNGDSYFNISNGTLGTTDSDHTVKIEDYGNGWYRCSITFKTTTDTTGAVRIYLSVTDGSVSVPLDGTNGVYLYGLQCEASAAQNYATSYIPTSGSTVTRNADVCNNAGSSDLISSTEGVLYVEVAALTSINNFQSISLSDGTNQNNIRFILGNVLNRASFQVKVGNTSQVFKNIDTTDITDFNKIAFKYKENDFAAWLNGVEVATDTSGTVPTVNQLSFTNGGAFNNFEGKVKSVAVFKEALTDEELAKITSTTQQEVFYEMRDRMLQIDADYYEFGDYTTRLKKLF